MLESLKNEINQSDDIIFKKVKIKEQIIYLINIETLTNSNSIYEFILNKINFLEKDNINLKNYLYYHLPTLSIKDIVTFNELKDFLLNGFTIIYINDKEILAIETKLNLTRGITETNYEKSLVGPKDAFIENYNTNIGLIRRRIKTTNLIIKSYTLGTYTKTKIGLLFLNNLCQKELIYDISKQLKNIDSKGIIDTNYLKKYLNNSKSLFPTLKITERPDLASLSLLQGKAVIIVDNSPDVLILPSFFIDYFHTSDDYYQKRWNTNFIRIIRLIAFIIAILLPSFYIALITHNPDNMPISLLLSFQKQRSLVPFPAFIEAIIMIITFEILRESDIRIPSTMGTAISILGGLVLGEAVVSAGIVSPIMIIVIALSTISSMLMQSIELINSIRFYRIINIFLASILGYYGIFLGIVLILTDLCNTKSIDQDYLYPFAPINFEKQKDGFLRIKKKENKI